MGGRPGRSKWHTVKERLLAACHIDAVTGCWVWTGCARNPKGYACIIVGGKRDLAHRASYREHVGPIPDGLCVLHKCDNHKCINPDHLFLGTRGDNNRDRTRKGRSARGVTQHLSKLTTEAVNSIRCSVEPLKVLAARFGVTMTSISYARRGKTWKHVETGEQQ